MEIGYVPDRYHALQTTVPSLLARVVPQEGPFWLCNQNLTSDFGSVRTGSFCKRW